MVNPLDARIASNLDASLRRLVLNDPPRYLIFHQRYFASVTMTKS